MPNTRSWLPIALILIVALAVRLCAATWWEARLPVGKKFFFGDSEGYWELASDIAHGLDYEYSGSLMFRTPGYPLVLTPLFWIFGDDPPVYIARAWNAIWGTAAVAGVMGLGFQLFSPKVGLIAGGMAALYPEAIGASVFILSEAAFCPLMLGQLLLAISAWQATTTKSLVIRSLAAGVVGGCATLIRPSWLLFTPFLLASTVVMFSERKRMLLLNSLQIAGICVAMLPWWVRNYAVSGAFVATSTEVGISLLDGLNPDADGSSNFSVSDIKFRRLVKQVNRNIRPIWSGLHTEPTQIDGMPFIISDEVTDDRDVRNAAIKWARENPRRVFELAMTKAIRMWNLWPNENAFRSWPLRIIVAMTYLPLLALGVIGLRRWGHLWPYWLLLVPAVYFTLLHMIFVSSIRYRLPPLLPLMAIAAAVLTVWFGEKLEIIVTRKELLSPSEG